ncbi:unnamed protein product [Alopecurus aequalis]
MAMRGGMVVVVVAVLSALLLLHAAEAQTLTVGYYSQRCPKAETIIFQEIQKVYINDKSIAAALLRLHFHDCFVNGCDASVLLDSSSNQAEKNAGPNGSLRGYGLIDTIKAKLEAACKQTVSCADILAYAARDSVKLASGGYNYNVPGGRPDGTVSSLQMAVNNLPAHNQRNITTLHAKYFKPKSLSLDDLIVLSGAHTIGVTKCGTFDYRLNNDLDKSMDATFRNQLRGKCNHIATNVVPLDDRTPSGFDTSYYANVLANRTVLESDAALNSLSAIVRNRVTQLKDRNTFLTSFGVSMGNMGKLRTSNPGKVRDNCRRVRL